MRYGRGYQRLLNVNPRYRYFYTITLCLMPAIFWLLFWYMPMEKSLARLDQEKRQFKKDGDACVEQQAACEKMLQNTDRMKEDVQQICASGSSVSEYVGLLMQHTQHAGLKLISLRASEQRMHDDYISDRMVFEAIGGMPAIIQFFSALSEHHLLIQCDDLSLQRQADDTLLLHCVLRIMIPKVSESA